MKTTETTLYSNTAYDFIATPIVGTKNIIIKGLPFTLKAECVIYGDITRIEPKRRKHKRKLPKRTKDPLTHVTVNNNTITLADADNYKEGETVAVVLMGPSKIY